jgi:RNA polymerase sigma-70 factor (ECF subfamily)
MSESLEALVARLGDGDTAAAGPLFLAFEPYLRLAVRRLIPAAYRAKFDSADVLQSVWADVLRKGRAAGWRFRDADHLRGFLFVAARNRLIDRLRQHRTAVRRQEPGAGAADVPVPSAQPRPSEVAQGADLWDRLWGLCPPEHRPILGLRRQGYSHAEIAARTGLHPDSVRRVLRTLARQLAFAAPAGGEGP